MRRLQVELHGKETELMALRVGSGVSSSVGHLQSSHRGFRREIEVMPWSTS